MLYVTI